MGDLATTVSGPAGTAFFGQGGTPRDVTFQSPDSAAPVQFTSTIEALRSAAESGRRAQSKPPEGAKEKLSCAFDKAGCDAPAPLGRSPATSGAPVAIADLVSHIPRSAWADPEINADVQWFAQREADRGLRRQQLDAVDKRIATGGSTMALDAQRKTLLNDLATIDKDQATAKERIKKRLVDRRLLDSEASPAR